MSGILFAHGRAAESIIPDITAAGATTINLPGANAAFIAGQQLFISEADGSETQWLGRAAVVTPDAIAFTRPLIASKNSGAKIWRPAAILETPATANLPERRTLAAGIALERSRAGDFFAVQVAEPQEALNLTLEGLTPAAELALIEWLHAHTQWGLHPFTIVSLNTLAAVRLQADTDAPLRREKQDGGRARVTLALYLLAEGLYQ